MSIADTGKFTAMCKTAGVEVNDLASTIKRTQQQIIRGGEHAKAETWLKRYGETAFDASGHLKDLNEMTLTLSRALKRAQAEGNGMAFVLGTMRGASADAITAIEDAEGVYQQAAGIVKNGLANPVFAHEVQGNINELNLQASHMHASFESALLPVANEIIPRLTERMGKLTQLIADNKDLIRDFGATAANAFMKIEQAAETVGGAVVNFTKAIYDFQKNPREQELVEKYKNDFTIKNIDDLIKKEQPKAYDVIKANPALYNQTVAIYKPVFDGLKYVQAEIKLKKKEIEEELKSLSLVSNADLTIGQERRAFEQNPELLETLRKARKIQEEATNIYADFDRTEYEKKIASVQKWRNEAFRETELSVDEREALEKLSSAKLDQIEHERAEKLDKIRQQITAGEQTELEKRIALIEGEKKSWIQAGMEKAEAEKLANQQLNNYLQNSRQELSDKVQSLYQTELENRLAQIEKEKQAWIDKCGDEVRATELAEQQKADAQRNAAMSVIRQQAKEYEAYQKGGLAGLQAYKTAQLAESGVNLDYLKMTPQQLQKFQQANQLAEKGLLPNFMTQRDKEMYRQERDRSERPIRNKFDSENYAIVDGKKTFLSEILGGVPLTIDLGSNSTLEIKGDGSQATFKDYQSDKEQTFNLSRLPDDLAQNSADINYAITDGVKTTLSEITQSFSEMPTVVQSTTESLGELSTAMQELEKNFPEVDSSVFGEFVKSFSELPTVVEGVMKEISAIELPEFPQDTELPAVLSDVNQSFSQMSPVIQTMTEALSEVTVRISNFSAAMENFSLSKQNTAQTEQRQPVNVSNTVQINEAHAWDSEHISELADKVAEVLRQEIISAIGGDSNTY